jgi:hyperosmotically inducible protein
MKYRAQFWLAMGAASSLFIAGCNKDADSTSNSSSGAARDYNSSSSSRDAGSATATTRRDSTSTLENTNAAAGHAADNTGINARDRADATLTPGDQGSSDSDRQISAQIRRAITSDDQLSTAAKNIKIITVNGKVTLRGPVKTEQEKQAITAAAQKVTGVSGLDDQLELKSAAQ